MNRSASLIALGLAAVAATAVLADQTRTPKTHRLEATPATVAVGYYWSEAKPALRIASGDIIDVDTMLTNNPAGLARAGVPDDKIQASLKAITAEVTGDRRGPGGHILTGPVFVEGAEPGDALEVKILSIDLPIDYGYNGCSGFVPENCERGTPSKIMTLDRKSMTSEFAPGIVIPLKPFFGSMGVAPAADLGRVSSNPPGKHAGNMDNKELVAGSTLYIPVFVPGALFEIGDGHAAQGDGEVDQTAIETSLRGRLQLTVRKGMPLNFPARGNRNRLHQHGLRSRSHQGDDDGDSGDGGLHRGHQEDEQAPGLPAGELGRQRRDHPARRQAEPRRPRPDAEKHLQVT